MVIEGNTVYNGKSLKALVPYSELFLSITSIPNILDVNAIIRVRSVIPLAAVSWALQIKRGLLVMAQVRVERTIVGCCVRTIVGCCVRTIVGCCVRTIVGCCVRTIGGCVQTIGGCCVGTIVWWRCRTIVRWWIGSIRAVTWWWIWWSGTVALRLGKTLWCWIGTAGWFIRAWFYIGKQQKQGLLCVNHAFA